MSLDSRFDVRVTNEPSIGDLKSDGVTLDVHEKVFLKELKPRGKSLDVSAHVTLSVKEFVDDLDPREFEETFVKSAVLKTIVEEDVPYDVKDFYVSNAFDGIKSIHEDEDVQNEILTWIKENLTITRTVEVISKVDSEEKSLTIKEAYKEIDDCYDDIRKLVELYGPSMNSLCAEKISADLRDYTVQQTGVMRSGYVRTWIEGYLNKDPKYRVNPYYESDVFINSIISDYVDSEFTYPAFIGTVVTDGSLIEVDYDDYSRYLDSLSDEIHLAFREERDDY